MRSASDLRRHSRGLRQLKDEFFSLAAHEIRTPITVIKAQAQLAERFYAQGKLQGDLIEKTLRIFVQESDRLARLCNDLLDIARLDSGCFEVHLTTFDLVSLVREAIEKHSSRIEAHRFELNVSSDIPSGAAFVIGDRERVQQIMNNLINNAIRYSPGGGTIRITLERVSEMVKVRVCDEGLGIPADKMKDIFKRYSQAHQSGLRGPAGLGLGLYLCCEALRRMGGEIHVQSEGAGKGAEFAYTLPYSNDALGTLGVRING